MMVLPQLESKFHRLVAGSKQLSRTIRRTEYCVCSTRQRLQRYPSCRLFSISSTTTTTHDATTTTTTTTTQSRPAKRRVDPMARRPTVKCDPYDQGGQPMAWSQAEMLLSTLHSDWKLVSSNDEDNQDDDTTTTETQEQEPPHAITRDFYHADFLKGAQFLQKLAAVAEMNNHYCSLTLHRLIFKKAWQTVTRCTCHTTVLQGLSTHDFHLAMVRLFFALLVYYYYVGNCVHCSWTDTTTSATHFPPLFFNFNNSSWTLKPNDPKCSNFWSKRIEVETSLRAAVS